MLNREARQRGSLLQAHYKIFTMGNSYPLTFFNSKIRHGTKKFSTAVDLQLYANLEDSNSCNSCSTAVPRYHGVLQLYSCSTRVHVLVLHKFSTPYSGGTRVY
jgi:hypothetical protein